MLSRMKSKILFASGLGPRPKPATPGVSERKNKRSRTDRSQERSAERSRRRSQSPVATIAQRPRPLGESTRPDNVRVVSKYVLPTVSMDHTFSDLKFSSSGFQLPQLGIDLFTCAAPKADACKHCSFMHYLS
jgi:hypothetical protein